MVLMKTTTDIFSFILRVHCFFYVYMVRRYSKILLEQNIINFDEQLVQFFILIEVIIKIYLIITVKNVPIICKITKKKKKNTDQFVIIKNANIIDTATITIISVTVIIFRFFSSITFPFLSSTLFFQNFLVLMKNC